jgi:predicted transcriptional regulator of viral defense system
VQEAFDRALTESSLNLQRIKEYAERMKSGSVNKKLSLLLDSGIKKRRGGDQHYR